MSLQTGILRFRVISDGPGVWVEVDGVAFPETGWTDFPTVVLAWWADAPVDLLEGRADAVEWRFMDGPYWLTIQSAGSENVRCLRQHRAGPQIVHQTTQDVVGIAAALERALAEAISAPGFGSPATTKSRALVSAHDRLRRTSIEATPRRG